MRSDKNTHQLLKSKASDSSIYGLMIAIGAVIIATAIVSSQSFNQITLITMFQAQRDNAILWLLDISPFAFAYWGQYVAHAIANQADSIISNHTQLLELEMEKNATQDSLTGLLNRTELRNIIENLILTQKKQGLALISFDVDDFKGINNTLGYDKGDLLLKHIALRMKLVIKGNIHMARMSGDEFAVLLSGISKKKDVQSVFDNIQSIFRNPFVIDSLNLHVESSMGSAFYPHDAENAESLFRFSDSAMYASKSSKRGPVFYSKDIDRQDMDRFTVKNNFRRALAEDELVLHFQPKIDADQQVREVEVLVRWIHPEKGFIPPDQFVPHVEDCGLNTELLIWVLEHALSQAHQWRQSGLDLGVAVNMSTLDLLDPKIPETIAAMLEKVELPANKLKLEITETTSIVEQDRALSMLNHIADMGVSISLDDFGTGYSSLTYLTQMPANEVKIDRSFVMRMLKEKDKEVIVRTIVDLAHNLSMKAVAEGVEDEATLKRLNDMGCDYLQGYHISRPLDADAFQTWIATWIKTSKQTKDIVTNTPIKLVNSRS